MNTLEAGAKQAVENCVAIKAGEHVVLITDRKNRPIAKAIAEAAEIRGGHILVYVLESLGKRPAIFPEAIGEALSLADASFYIAGNCEGERESFRSPMLKAVESNEKLRHAHMPGVTLDVMKSGMNYDYQEVQRVSQAVYETVSKARRIRVTSPAGTDLTARFGRNPRWVICDGRIKPGHWSNLPDGEVFTAPQTVSGRAVIDGCLGDYLEKFGTLEKTPVTVDIVGGRAVKKSVFCENKKVADEFRKCLFSTDANSDRVGEFAIGTNIGLVELTGNLLQDEKFPGVHIAFGSPYPDRTGANWDSEGHLDAVIRKVTIYVGGAVMMKDGQFLI